MREQNASLTGQLTEMQSQMEWARQTEKSLIESQVLTAKPYIKYLQIRMHHYSE